MRPTTYTCCVSPEPVKVCSSLFSDRVYQSICGYCWSYASMVRTVYQVDVSCTTAVRRWPPLSGSVPSITKRSRCAYPILHLITAPSTRHQPKIRKGAPPRKTPNDRRIFILMRKRNERIDRKVRYRAHTRQLTTQIGTSDITTSTPLSAHLVLNISNSRKPSEFLI